MDDWAWELVARWTEHRIQLPVSPLFCIIAGPTRGRGWSATAARGELRRIAAHVGVRRRFAPHQLRHAHPIEMAHEGFQGESRNVAEFRARAFFTTDLLALELNELGTLVNARDATSRIQQFLGEIPPMSWESSESPLDS